MNLININHASDLGTTVHDASDLFIIVIHNEGDLLMIIIDLA